MRTTKQSDHRTSGSAATALAFKAWAIGGDLKDRLRKRAADDTGAVAIEYVIVAIALLAIAGAIAAALTALGNDAVSSIPGSVSEAGG